jgi:type II secretory pathway pseudopilin PulG
MRGRSRGRGTLRRNSDDEDNLEDAARPGRRQNQQVSADQNQGPPTVSSQIVTGARPRTASISLPIVIAQSQTASIPTTSSPTLSSPTSSGQSTKFSICHNKPSRTKYGTYLVNPNRTFLLGDDEMGGV